MSLSRSLTKYFTVFKTGSFTGEIAFEFIVVVFGRSSKVGHVCREVCFIAVIIIN